MRSLLVAIQFLTILPLARRAEITREDMAASVGAFPVVGLLQGAALVATAYLAGRVLSIPAGPAAALVLLVHVVLNGAFHLDGLSDTFDAIAKRGDRDSKLAVMKDGRSGAAGVSALVLSVLLKYALIATVIGQHPYSANYTLLMMPVFSRWAMTAAMLHGKPARPEGLGKIFIEGTGGWEFAVSTLTVFVVMIMAAMFLGPLLEFRHLFNVVAMAVLYVFTLLMLLLFKGQFGGLNGDTLGALAELSENVFLLMVVIWSALFI